MRKSMIRMLVAGIMMAAAAIAQAGGLTVTNVTAQQRWPWNGLVDIDYEILGDNADEDVYVYPTGFDKDRNIAFAPRTLTGDGADGQSVKPGRHRLTWNMAADEPTLHSSAFAVSVHAFSGSQPYLVLDLSSGAESLNYPYWYSATPPDLDNDACRTTNLWLRLMLPGTFMMGSPTDELGRDSDETLHQVTLTKPYYIGVFETTQKQYALITGADPSSGNKGDTRPVDSVSYNMVRGAVNGAAWPLNNQVDADSVLGKLRLRTNLTFDLPTEAQWEYACRAGTSTALNNGHNLTNVSNDASMTEVGRYHYNWSDGKGGHSGYTGWSDFYGVHTKVGSYLSNAWGLCDMHGNVWEICLDWGSSYPGGAVSDPSGATSGQRIIRGGYYDGHANVCRAANRQTLGGGPGEVNSQVGFRLVVIPPVQ